MLQGFLQQLEDSEPQPPHYLASRCMLERGAMSECHSCRNACPHQAISLNNSEVPQLGIRLDHELCSSCGLCVQVCPTGALEYEAAPLLQALRELQEIRMQELPQLACSQSGAGDGKLQIACLGRLTVGTLAAVGCWADEIELLHGNCNQCQLGSSTVPARLAEIANQVDELRQASAKAIKINIRPATSTDHSSKLLNRRQGIASLFGFGKRYASKWLADSWQDKLAVFSEKSSSNIPQEWRWRNWAALRPRPAVDASIYWPAPLVTDECNDCPVCQNICPTQAISRQTGEAGQTLLTLNLSACTGCHACIDACPPNAMWQQSHWLTVAFAGPIVLREFESTIS